MPIRHVIHQVVIIMSDPQSIVKQTLLVNNMDRLCVFLGHQKSTDVLLCHMLTFFNDKRDWRLRVAFFRSIVGVATYVGSKSLDRYVLPLIEKCLVDGEEFVVEETLNSLAKIVRIGLFNITRVRQLSQSIVPLLAHPGAWVRYGAVGFVCAVAKVVSPVHVQCMLLPLLKAHLRRPVCDAADEVQLLDALHEPVSRDVFEYIVTSDHIDEYVPLTFNFNFNFTYTISELLPLQISCSNSPSTTMLHCIASTFLHATGASFPQRPFSLVPQSPPLFPSPMAMAPFTPTAILPPSPISHARPPSSTKMGARCVFGIESAIDDWLISPTIVSSPSSLLSGSNFRIYDVLMQRSVSRGERGQADASAYAALSPMHARLMEDLSRFNLTATEEDLLIQLEPHIAKVPQPNSRGAATPPSLLAAITAFDLASCTRQLVSVHTPRRWRAGRPV